MSELEVSVASISKNLSPFGVVTVNVEGSLPV